MATDSEESCDTDQEDNDVTSDSEDSYEPDLLEDDISTESDSEDFPDTDEDEDDCNPAPNRKVWQAAFCSSMIS